MRSPRWETERSAWLKARAGHRPAIRRRAELLAKTARRLDRSDAGVGDAPFTTVATRNLWYRGIHREEGAANMVGWFMATTLGLALVLAAIGPALLIGLAIYGIRWKLVPSLGRMRSGPFWIATALVGALGIALLVIDHHLATTWRVASMSIFGQPVWPLPPAAMAWSVWAWAQLVIGLGRAAWRIRAWGWPAVERVAAKATTTVAAVKLERLDADDTSPDDSDDADDSDEAAPIVAPVVLPIYEVDDPIEIDEDEIEWDMDDLIEEAALASDHTSHQTRETQENEEPTARPTDHGRHRTDDPQRLRHRATPTSGSAGPGRGDCSHACHPDVRSNGVTG